MFLSLYRGGGGERKMLLRAIVSGEIAFAFKIAFTATRYLLTCAEPHRKRYRHS